MDLEYKDYLLTLYRKKKTVIISEKDHIFGIEIAQIFIIFLFYEAYK